MSGHQAFGVRPASTSAWLRDPASRWVFRRPTGRAIWPGSSRKALAAALFAASLSIVIPLGPALAAPAGPDAAKASDRFDIVVLDAGHGGHDEGAKGPSGLREKDVVLDITMRLAKQLRSRGIEVILTRSGDRFLSLEERTAVANDAHADLFVSIHANASPSRKPRGVETYFASLDATDQDARDTAERENSAFGATAPSFDRNDPLAAILGDLIATEHLQESSEFAKLAQHEMAEVKRARSRGVKQAPFVVLMGVQMPASLVEIGFITNPDEEKAMRRSGLRREIVRALAEAISNFGARYDARRGVHASGTGNQAARP